MRKQLLGAVLLTASFGQQGLAQYYYKDIISNRQVIAERAALKEKKVRNVSVKSFESYGEPSEGFFCEKKISKDHKQIDTYTKTAMSGKSILSSWFNDKGLLIKTTDSSEINVSTTVYDYDTEGRLVAINSDSHSSDDDFKTSLSEVRQYTYDEKGLPAKLLRIRNHKDSTVINFVTDEEGNITEEDEVALYGKHYYYYYDEQHRLTDIVRYNVVRKKAWPDFVFEYNQRGQLAQMTVSEEGHNTVYSDNDEYTVWKYFYDGDLRISEKCYSQNRKLLGYFEYEYK